VLDGCLVFASIGCLRHTLQVAFLQHTETT